MIEEEVKITLSREQIESHCRGCYFFHFNEYIFQQGNYLPYLQILFCTSPGVHNEIGIVQKNGKGGCKPVMAEDISTNRYGVTDFITASIRSILRSG